MAFQLAQAFIDIHARTSKIQAQIAQLKSQMNRQLGGINVGTAIERVLGRFVLLRAAFAGVVLSGKEFIRFDKNMVNQMAIQSGVADELQRSMSSLAQELAIKTGQATADLAEGFYFLASAGLTAEQQLAALPVAANFATAGVLDLGKATSILMDAQKSAGLASDDAQENMMGLLRVSDVVTKAALMTNATVDEMGTAVARAGSAVTTFGSSFEEAVATLGVFANVSKKSGMGSTALLGALRVLQTAAVKNKAVWNANGVSVFDATGKFIGMGKALQQLEKRMSGMSDEAVRGFLVQTLKLPNKSLDFVTSILHMGGALDKLTEELLNAGGTAEMVANKQMESLSKQAVKIAQQFLSLGIGALEPFAAALIVPAKSMGFFAESIAKFNMLLAGMPAKILAVAAAFAAFALRAKLIKGLVAFFPELGPQIRGVLLAIRDNIRDLPFLLSTATKVAGTFLGRFISGLPLVGGLLKKTGGLIAKMGGGLLAKMPKLVQGLVGGLGFGFKVALGPLSLAAIGLGKILEFLHKISVVGPIIERTFDILADSLTSLGFGIGPFLGGLTRLFGDVFSRVIGISLGAAFSTQFTRIFSGIASGLKGSALFKSLTENVHTLGEMFFHLGRIVVKVVESVADALAAGVVGILQWIGAISGKGPENVVDAFRKMGSYLAGIFKVLADNWSLTWRIIADVANVAIFSIREAFLMALGQMGHGIARLLRSLERSFDVFAASKAGWFFGAQGGKPADFGSLDVFKSAAGLMTSGRRDKKRKDDAIRHLGENSTVIGQRIAKELAHRGFSDEGRPMLRGSSRGKTEAEKTGEVIAKKMELPTFIGFEDLQKQIQEQLVKEANPQLEQIHQDLAGVQNTLQESLGSTRATAKNTSKMLPPGVTGELPPAHTPAGGYKAPFQRVIRRGE